MKSKLTRQYNAGAHRSQALQDDVALGGRKRKAGASTPTPSLEAVADDGVVREADKEEEEEEEEVDVAAVAAAFRKKKRGGKKGAAKKGAAKKGGGSSRKKARKE